MNRLFCLSLMIPLLSACAHQRSVLPDKKEVKISRDPAPDNCRDLGSISGTTTSAHGTREQALEDLKQEAANKGANYVVIKQYSAYGTGVVGIGYDCP